jgi:uncharacterized glyoxalase superfamily protein PhnB
MGGFMQAKLDMIGLTVKDMAKSVEFYRLLGVEFAGDASGEHVEGKSGGMRIGFDTVEMMQNMYADWVEPVGQRMSLAFLLGSAAEVDELYQKILDTGYVGAKEPWDAFWGQRYAVVVDPDGNKVDLFAPLS